MRVIELHTGEIYHICNRAVEGRSIFIDEDHCSYFLESMLFANTTSDLMRNWRRSITIRNAPQESPLVEIFCLTLMRNHFHIGMRQLVDGGVAKLMQRVCNGFAKYFNERNKRKGRLFMAPYTSVHIASDAQAAHLITYVHANPLDISFPEWRDGKVKEWKRAKKFLEEYRYSSLPFFLGENTAHPLFEKLIKKDFPLNYYQEPKDHMAAIRAWSAERGYDHIF